MVYNGKDRIVAIALWQLGDQVHRYDFEWGRCYWDRDPVFRGGFLWEVFVLLTGRTPLHVFPYPIIHSGPVVMSLYQCDRVVSTWMACRRVVVVLVQDLSFVVFRESCVSDEQFFGENYHVLIVQCAGVYAWWSRQHICCRMDLSWNVFNDEIVVL
jgi:hypothetical protein